MTRKVRPKNRKLRDREVQKTQGGNNMADLRSLLGDDYKEGMTLEDIEKALEAKELVEKSAMDGLVPKTLLDKASSEAADYKKRWKATQTAQKQAAIEDKGRTETLETQVAELKRENQLTKFQGEYLGMGYKQEDAAKIATAMVDGDTETVFALTKQHQDGIRKAVEADLMKNMGTPPAGQGDNGGIDYIKHQQTALDNGDITSYIGSVLQQATQETQ